MFEQNEIRDYIARSPRRFRFDGKRMINKTGVRFTWLASIASGTIDERINRRAGLLIHINLSNFLLVPAKGGINLVNWLSGMVEGAWLMMYV